MSMMAGNNAMPLHAISAIECSWLGHGFGVELVFWRKWQDSKFLAIYQRPIFLRIQLSRWQYNMRRQVFRKKAKFLLSIG